MALMVGGCLWGPGAPIGEEADQGSEGGVCGIGLRNRTGARESYDTLFLTPSKG